MGPFWLGAFATVVLTGIYTVFGGFRGLIYGFRSSPALDPRFGEYYVIGLDALGGWGELVRMASERSDNSYGVPCRKVPDTVVEKQ